MFLSIVNNFAMNPNYKELIYKACISPNDRERSECEAAILELMNREFQNFFWECMKIFLSSDNDLSLRKSAGVIMSGAAKETKVGRSNLGQEIFMAYS